MAHLGYDLRVSATLYFLALATELSLFFFLRVIISQGKFIY